MSVPVGPNCDIGFALGISGLSQPAHAPPPGKQNNNKGSALPPELVTRGKKCKLAHTQWREGEGGRGKADIFERVGT